MVMEHKELYGKTIKFYIFQYIDMTKAHSIQVVKEDIGARSAMKKEKDTI